MKGSYFFILCSVLAVSVHAQDTTRAVRKGGFDSKVKFEHILSGHLEELNGKYKLRVTETVYQPNGFIGDHHHVGPGVRLVLSGELTYVQPDTTRIFKAGDYFYESGDVTHTAYNRTKKQTVILNFEILPSGWSGPSTILPMHDHAQ